MVLQKKIILLILFVFLSGTAPFAQISAPAQTPAEKAKQDERMYDMLFRGDDKARRESADYIKLNQPAAFPEQLAVLLTGKSDADVKQIAFEALKLYSTDKTFSLWIRVLKTTQSFVIKKEVIDFLASTHDRRLVPPVAEELASPFYAVRESAIRALKLIGDDRMFPLILNMASSSDSVKKVYALEAINELYDMRFLPVLLDMLKSDNKSIRIYTLGCIEKYAIANALGQVRQCAQSDAMPDVRIRAFGVLVKMNDNGSMYIFINAVSSPERDLRAAAVDSIRRMRLGAGSTAISNQLAVEKDHALKESMLDTLLSLGNAGGYTGITKILSQDDDVYLRIRAAYILGEIRSPQSSTLLLQSLGSEKDYRVRAEICSSLSPYKTRQVMQVLLNEIIEEPLSYVRTAALYSLATMKDRTVMGQLFDLYGTELDPVLKEKVRKVLRELMQQ